MANKWIFDRGVALIGLLFLCPILRVNFKKGNTLSTLNLDVNVDFN